MVVVAHIDRAFAVVGLRITRHRNEHGLFDAGQRAQAARNFIAVHTGKPDIEQHGIGSEFADSRERSRAFVYRLDLVSEGTQQQRYARRSIAVVIDDQHAARGADDMGAGHELWGFGRR